MDQRLKDRPVWLSTSGAASWLGVTPHTLYRFIEQGELPAFRFGRVIRIRLDDLNEYVESHRIKPGELQRVDEDDEEGAA